MSPTIPRIAILISFSGQGGVERMIVNLLQAMAKLPLTIDLLLIKGNVADDDLPANIHVHRFASGHSYRSLPELIRYLKSAQPTALIAAKHRAMQVAVAARWLSGQRLTLVGRLGTTVSAALADRHPLRLWWWRQSVRLFYPHLDRLIAVSAGVRDDVLAMCHNIQVDVIDNPVISDKLYAQAAAPCPHAWLAQRDIPVIIGVGRLTRQKDFATLIRAFAKLHDNQRCRLLIVGDGNERGALQQLATDLGVKEAVDFTGYQRNPYSYVARASLFVLSSRWEGSPNALTEAMALGIPVVSTDCPSGPRELLVDGRYGMLVAVGDSDAMTNAMAQTLALPPPAETLKTAVSRFNADYSAARYLAACGITTTTD